MSCIDVLCTQHIYTDKNHESTPFEFSMENYKRVGLYLIIREWSMIIFILTCCSFMKF